MSFLLNGLRDMINDLNPEQLTEVKERLIAQRTKAIREEIEEITTPEGLVDYIDKLTNEVIVSAALYACNIKIF